MMTFPVKYICLVIFLSLSLLGAQAQESLLIQKFKNPSAEYKPRTWYHVMSGNMSKEGVTKDLEAMHDVGIGGLILFNITHFIPKGNVKFNSPEHIDMIAHAAAECERLGMSFGIHNCDGWRNSGGPWITPEHSMKQVVFSEIVVEGGEIDVQLRMPASRSDFYKDIAVVAYPALKSEIDDALIKPKITASDPECNVDLVNDGKADVITKLKGSVPKRAWIQFDYGKPKTIRSVYIDINKRIADKGKTWLQTSNDGKTFETIRELKMLRLGKMENGFDDVFEPISARYFRVQTEVEMDLMEMDLSNISRFENMLARTSLFQREDAQLQPIKEPNNSMIIDKDAVIDLSAGLKNNGKFTAKLSPGKWTIMRFGYTSTGAKNGPASSEGTGFEVDKMSKESFKIFYEGYVRNVIDAAKKVAPNALQYIEIDSYEVGGQNWTKGYEKQFKEIYDYNLVKFLPIYAGRYIESAELTDNVLWDIRNLNSDLITENYFGYFNELCHQDTLISYAEPYSFNGPFNELDAGSKVDVPMGEFWMHQRYQTETAVSSARTYGKPLISAEAFSAQPEINWKSHPGFMKLTGDKAWTLGINEFMFHRFAHQANTHIKPGMTMSQWGSHIDRTQTWWYNAGKAWFKYLARGQYLLRQGNPVSDLLVFVGNGSPNSVVRRTDFKPGIPNKINFDCINADALINRISSDYGQLILPEGTKYNALVLFNTENINLPTLKKIQELSEQGIVVIGQKPKEIGGYNITDSEKEEFKTLVESIWEKEKTYTHYNWEDIFNENNIVTDLKIGTREDINYIHRQTANEDIYFFYNPDSVSQTFDCRFNVEGKIPELWNQNTGETKKLVNFSEEGGFTTIPISLSAEGSVFIVFRESSKKLDAIKHFASNAILKPEFNLNSQNQVEMTAYENGTYSVDFESGATNSIQIDDLQNPIIIDKPWKVKFQKQYGFDSTLQFKQLIDWKDHESEEVKYYSGTATYSTQFKVEKEYLGGNKRLIMNLGEVSVAAKVFVNGKELGVVWKSPFVIDITEAVREGKNDLKIEITNTWTNRLIGDERYPNETGYDVTMDKMPDWYINNDEPNLGKRKAFCAFPFYKESDELHSSGLLGPVRISVSKKVNLKSN
jgi:hypothetical protein